MRGKMSFSKFELVKSIAGRDLGNVYLIKEILDKDYVLLIDGKAKTISNPKKKKIKHITSLGVVEESLHKTFNDKSKTNDGVIRKIVKNFEEKC